MLGISDELKTVFPQKSCIKNVCTERVVLKMYWKFANELPALHDSLNLSLWTMTLVIADIDILDVLVA